MLLNMPEPERRTTKKSLRKWKESLDAQERILKAAWEVLQAQRRMLAEEESGADLEQQRRKKPRS